MKLPLLALAVCTLFAANAQSAVIHLQDDFESGAIGDPLLSPWVTSGIGNAIYASTAHGTSARITAANPGASPSNLNIARGLSNPFEYQANQILSFSLDLNMGALNPGDARTQVTARLFGAGNLNVFVINFLDDRRIALTTPTGLDYFRTLDDTAFLEYADDRWYTINVTLDTTTSQMSVNLFDQSTSMVVGSQAGKNPVNQIDIIGIDIFRGGVNGQQQSLLVDNISITSIPEPSSLLLIFPAALGLVGMRYRCRA